jgi:hypothetical protein
MPALWRACRLALASACYSNQSAVGCVSERSTMTNGGISLFRRMTCWHLATKNQNNVSYRVY